MGQWREPWGRGRGQALAQWRGNWMRGQRPRNTTSRGNPFDLLAVQCCCPAASAATPCTRTWPGGEQQQLPRPAFWWLFLVVLSIQDTRYKILEELWRVALPHTCALILSPQHSGLCVSRPRNLFTPVSKVRVKNKFATHPAKMKVEWNEEAAKKQKKW